MKNLSRKFVRERDELRAEVVRLTEENRKLKEQLAGGEPVRTSDWSLVAESGSERATDPRQPVLALDGHDQEAGLRQHSR